MTEKQWKIFATEEDIETLRRMRLNFSIAWVVVSSIFYISMLYETPVYFTPFPIIFFVYARWLITKRACRDDGLTKRIIDAVHKIHMFKMGDEIHVKNIESIKRTGRLVFEVRTSHLNYEQFKKRIRAEEKTLTKYVFSTREIHPGRYEVHLNDQKPIFTQDLGSHSRPVRKVKINENGKTIIGLI